jgi:hypothetical protein
MTRIMLHCIKIKEKFCAVHDEKSAAGQSIMAFWRMASGLKASIERAHCSGFPLGLIRG